MRSLRVSSALSAALALAPAAPLAGAATAARPLALAEAVAIASASTPAVRLAGLGAEEAQAKIGQARAAFLPSLTGSASGLDRTFNARTLGFSFPTPPGTPAPPDLIGPVESVDARLKASQTVFDAGSWERLRAAHRGLEASRADQGASAEAAAQRAAIAYLRAARAGAVAAARRSDLEIAQALVGLADAQVQAGVTGQIDATRARVLVAASQGALLVALNQLARAQIELARSLGADPAARFALLDTLGTASALSDAPADSAAALVLALARRPEVAAERARQLKAESERSAILGERLPRVDLTADVGLSGVHPSDAISTRQVSLALSVPLLDGLRREARSAEQGAVVRESEVRGEDLRQQIAAEVDAARLDLASGLDQQGVAAEQLRLAEDELAQSRERFEHGVANNVEVINAQASLVRARDAEIDARFASALARVALARATGLARTLR